jgi:hypothetical protein
VVADNVKEIKRLSQEERKVNTALKNTPDNVLIEKKAQPARGRPLEAMFSEHW